MKIRILLGAAALLATQLIAPQVQAAAISYNKYSKADNSQIIQGEGLQWLSWNNTLGMSINQALAKYQQDGWRLASNLEMASLLNNFEIGNRTWTSTEDAAQISNVAWSSDENSSSHYFIRMFGITRTGATCAELGRNFSCYLDSDPLAIANAMFGSDANNNGKYNTVQVMDDASHKSLYSKTVRLEHQAAIWQDIRDRTLMVSDSAVALVRTASPVSGPGSIGLLVAGLLLLRRQRRTQ